MKYETATIASLMLDPANVRTHDSKNLESIKASLARFGQQKPIVVNSKGIIVAGNGTMMAAKMLNWSSVEIVRTDLEGAEAIAYAIADNRTAELAGWDEAALAQQLAALQIDDEELANIAGFTDAEIEAMTGAFDVDATDAPNMKDGDRDPFRQMTFTLHDEQHAIIEKALQKAAADGGGKSSINTNSNGNALAFACEVFLRG